MSETIEVRLPSDSTESAQSHVRAWLKSVGEAVAEHEPLLEIETDKVTVEVPAPCSGVLAEILAPVDSEVTADTVLARIAHSSSATAPGVTAGARAASAPAATVVASGEAATASRPRAAGKAPAPSPAVRRLLAEHGLAPDAVAGTGEGGRISVDDVLRASGALPPGRDAGRPVASTPQGGRTESGNAADEPAVRRVPHARTRRQIAAHMVESLLHTAPHVTTVFEADLGAVLAHRERHRAAYEARGTPLSLTCYFIGACVDALRAVPEVNARWTDDALEFHERIDIGVGTALADGGLVVPVIRDVGALDLPGIAHELADRVTRARAGRLVPADVRGGTFTISNHGVSGSLLAAPIVINQPQSAILGIGKLERRAVVVADGAGERIVARPRCYVTLTIDHRVLDGAQANRFLQVLVQRLGQWQD
jgi:2-oxoglutarate dehydrogenase E2 component (dihydrolipoamide succinyltransferase)